ncbi:MAG: hypothetical protein WBE46_09695 [Dehalococcoidia bacterium]
MNIYLYNDPTTKSKRRCLRMNAIDIEQASTTCDAHGNNPPLSPLILRGDNEGENPYFKVLRGTFKERITM